VTVQIDPAHSGHIDVGDQAGGAAKMGGAQELLGGRKSLGDKTHRPHESLQSLADRLIVVDYRN
jgi:hypothetical protein